MKVLTIIAGISVPLTLMAGIYGMNFDNMPELHSRWAFALGLITATRLSRTRPKQQE